MKTNYFTIPKNNSRTEAILDALKTIENTIITPSLNCFLVRTPEPALCSEMYPIEKEEYYNLINPFKTKPFYSVESSNGMFKIWVGRPEELETIITTSFNLYDYPEFTSSLIQNRYLHIKSTHKAENFCSLRVELLEAGALTNLMEDLAELLATHVAKDLQAVPA